jgi:uncharacterized protein (DUF983 family)
VTTSSTAFATVADVRQPTPAVPSGHEVGSLRILLRGLTKRCPRCGERKLFVHWLKVKARCPRCRLRLERTEGAFLGSMTINYAVTMCVWIVLLIVWLALTLPDVKAVPLFVTSLALVGLLPVVLYPFAKTTWSAIDLLAWRAQPDYLEPNREPEE